MKEKKNLLYTIGIGVNLFDARALLVDEERKIVLEVEVEKKSLSANETISTVITLIEKILSLAKKYKDRIKGLGIALGGIVNHQKGIVHWPQKEDKFCTYVSVSLKKYIEKKFNFPVILENDANACIWAEHLINFPENKNLLYMFSGVGCGIIIDGKLYRGRDGVAGELFINQHEMMSCWLGNFSLFKQWPADLDMVARAKEVISLGKSTSLIKRISSTGELTFKDIILEVKNKDKVAIELVKEAAFCLGVKIAFLVNLLNPEVIIIGGGLEELGEIFLDECTKIIKRFAFAETVRNLKVVLSKLKKQAVALGVSLMI